MIPPGWGPWFNFIFQGSNPTPWQNKGILDQGFFHCRQVGVLNVGAYIFNEKSQMRAKGNNMNQKRLGDFILRNVCWQPRRHCCSSPSKHIAQQVVPGCRICHVYLRRAQWKPKVKPKKIRQRSTLKPLVLKGLGIQCFAQGDLNKSLQSLPGVISNVWGLVMLAPTILAPVARTHPDVLRGGSCIQAASKVSFFGMTFF